MSYCNILHSFVIDINNKIKKCPNIFKKTVKQGQGQGKAGGYQSRLSALFLELPAFTRLLVQVQQIHLLIKL